MVSMDLIAVGRNIIIIYVILFVINMIATYFIHSRKFKASRNKLNNYNSMLKELYNIYKKEEGSRENNFMEEDLYEEDIDSVKNEMPEFGGADNE